MGLVATAEIEAARLEGERVAVLGYGSQGRAQALNLRDSGVAVIVGLRAESRRRETAAADGLTVTTLREAVANATMVAMLTPDETHPRLYEKCVAPNLAPSGALVFAHGFNVHYGRLSPRPDLDVLLVAPLGIGERVRAEFEAGRGTAGLVAVGQDASGRGRPRALGYARALGHHRAAVIETSFAEETETDLFAEQVVLVGGLSRLVEDGFATLLEAGYQPEIAYFCCLEEASFMADMLRDVGLAGLWEKISTTAAYGASLTGSRVINAASRQAMREALEFIRSGSFAADLRSGGASRVREGELQRMRASALEAVRRRLRGGPATSGGMPGPR